MSITIRRFIHSDEKVWDAFVASSNNGTLFHTRKFLSYHPKDRFLDHSLVFEKKGNPGTSVFVAFLGKFPFFDRRNGMQKRRIFVYG